jgi:ribonuclease P protein component
MKGPCGSFFLIALFDCSGIRDSNPIYPEALITFAKSLRLNSNPTRNTFRKSERLCSKKLIDQLFKDGKSMFVNTTRIVWLDTKSEQSSHAQVLIIIPKKNLKKAVDRNRMKRLVREVYRTNKHAFISLLLEKNIFCLLAFIYTGKTVASHSKMESTILLSLKRLIEAHEETAG